MIGNSKNSPAGRDCVAETHVGSRLSRKQTRGTPKRGGPLSEICPPRFQEWYQLRLQGRGGGVAAVIGESLVAFRVLPGHGRWRGSLWSWVVGISWACCLPPSLQRGRALPKLLDSAAELAVQFPRLRVLGDFSLLPGPGAGGGTGVYGLCGSRGPGPAQ